MGAFREDWKGQCDAVDEEFDDYAPDALSVIASIISGSLLSVGGSNETRAAALWDEDSQHFYACCMLNKVMLPGTSARTLRVRHLIVSPLLDYGEAPVQMYPDVVIGVMLGIINLSSSVLEAEHIHFHLRSPEDMAFFRAFGTALGGENIFESVQSRGAWLYITKAGAVGTAPAEEQI